MQHIRFKETDPNASYSKIAIATYNAGHYKVYLHTISGTGVTSQLSSKPTTKEKAAFQTLSIWIKELVLRVFYMHLTVPWYQIVARLLLILFKTKTT